MENDSLFGDQGNDTLYGDLGDDSLYGGAGTDLLYGDQGEETKFGGKGNDVVFGNQGDDTLYGLDGNDFLSGNENDDVLLGGMGTDTLYGGLEDDTLRGGMQNDVLFGDKGRDVLFGDLGADTLTGNSGGDTLSDIFVVGRVTGALTKTTGGPLITDADLITDFQVCIDFISLTGGVSYADLNITKGTGANVGNTIIQDKSTGEFLAILRGIDADDIDGSAFLPGGPPTVRIRATDAFAAEPTIGQAVETGEFTISVPCAPEEDLPVRYTVTGTATNGTDYNLLNGVAIIPAGSEIVRIPVIPISDTLGGEGIEEVTLTLDSLPGYNVAASPSNKATVAIFEGPVIPPGSKPTIL
jgi:RTX calcium-binding nonapeptide repeat (4 copies)